MRLMLINPNTTIGLTDMLMASARQVLAVGTEIDAFTAERGVPYISTRSEAIIGGMSVLEILAEHHHKYDGAIIAAFGDPGLGAARELFDFPIVGLAEAGMHTASLLGGRFSIVTFAQALAPWYSECVSWNHMESRCAAIRTLDEPFQSITGVQEEKEALLVELALKSVTEDDVDVIVLAGAPLAGLAPAVCDRVPIPIIDCPQAAVKLVEGLVSLSPSSPTQGSFRRPLAKSSIGLTDALSNRIAHL